jgi:hypothetical protein
MQFLWLWDYAPCKLEFWLPLIYKLWKLMQKICGWKPYINYSASKSVCCNNYKEVSIKWTLQYTYFAKKNLFHDHTPFLSTHHSIHYIQGHVKWYQDLLDNCWGIPHSTSLQDVKKYMLQRSVVDRCVQSDHILLIHPCPEMLPFGTKGHKSFREDA